MPFCINCGQQLANEANFCSGCGTAVNGTNQNAQRKIFYEGNLHKCPSCGEVLDSFTSHCPSCGYEIRDARSSNSVRELASKLEKIEAQKMPHIEEKKSVMKLLVGKDFKEENEIEEALERFEEQKQQEKANLIVNFSVPNTKEDILEFMILAASNIEVKKGIGDKVSQAWISKLDQIYERAKLLMGNTPAFTQIKSIYDKKKTELKNRKFKGLAIASFIVGGHALPFGGILFLAELFAGSAFFVLLGLGLIALGIKCISIYNRNK